MKYTKDNFEINIYGAGLYGILLANKLSKLSIFREKNIKIKLLEKNNNILSGWNYLEINGLKFNNGFHAIEMPRAEKTYQQIIELLEKDIFIKKENLKLISINGFTTQLGSSLTEWPNYASTGLSDLLNFNNKFSLNNVEEKLKNEINNYEVGKTILKCLKRYSNTLNETWTEFYPWFFPKEFIKNIDEDEGSKFRFKIIEGSIEPYYVEPKDNLFFGLKNKIEENLQKNNVKIIKNIKLKEKQIIRDKQNNVYTIWASSSAHILNNDSEIGFKELITASRYLLIAIFSIEIDSLIKWKNTYQYFPSEILFLNKEIPSLSRASFPNTIDKRNPTKNFIYLEYYSESKILSKNVIKKSCNCLTNIFKKNISYEGSTLGRKIYYLNHNNLNRLEKVVLKKAERLDLNIPYVYWGPINMAKCGIEAEKSAIKINEELINLHL